jgi:hypothetical protein
MQQNPSHIYRYLEYCKELSNPDDSNAPPDSYFPEEYNLMGTCYHAVCYICNVTSEELAAED